MKQLLALLALTILAPAQAVTTNTRIYYPLSQQPQQDPITKWLTSVKNKFETWKNQHWKSSTPVQPMGNTTITPVPSTLQRTHITPSYKNVSHVCAAIVCSTAGTCFKVSCQKSYNKNIGQGAHYYFKKQAQELMQKCYEQ